MIWVVFILIFNWNNAILNIENTKEVYKMTRHEEKNTSKLLPLTSDLVFKAVYGRNTASSNAALIALLNRLLERERDPIV